MSLQEFRSDINELIERSMTVSGGSLESESIAVFDWTALCNKEKELEASCSGLNEEDSQHFWADNNCDAQDIREYQFDDTTDFWVKKGRWLPIGVLGLDIGDLNSYRHSTTDGLLLLDLRTSKTNPSVWLSKIDYLQTTFDRVRGVKTGPIIKHLTRWRRPDARQVAATLSELSFDEVED